MNTPIYSGNVESNYVTEYTSAQGQANGRTTQSVQIQKTLSRSYVVIGRWK